MQRFPEDTQLPQETNEPITEYPLVTNEIDIEIETEDTNNRPEDANSKSEYDPKDIDITVEQISLYNIISRLRYNEIDLTTMFQRKGGLWKNYYQSRLIESILLRLPLPSFYFDASNDDKWLVVDGLQRLTSLKNFVIEKTLKLQGLEVLAEFNGLSYDDLPRHMKRRIDEFQITVYLIKPGTPLEVKYDVFNRINTGGLTLTTQEIRHALNQGKATDYLRDLVYKSDNISAENYTENYSKYIGVNDERMTGRELILRYIAFYNHHWSIYSPSLLNFLNMEMANLSSYSDEKLRELEVTLWKVAKLCLQIFGEDVFSKSLATPDSQKKIRRLNSSLFEVWTSLLAKLSDGELLMLLKKKELIREDFKALLKDSEFDKSISYSTSSKKHVHTRFSKVEHLINNYKND